MEYHAAKRGAKPVQIKGYIEVVYLGVLSKRWETFYDRVELVRYKGDLWWVYGTSRDELHEVSGLPHIATWHFRSFEQSAKMYEENSLGLALRYEEHHLNRIWCLRQPEEAL